MVKIEAATQGVDNGFKYTGSYDSIEFGEVTVAKARELMRELPDQGGVSQEYLEGNEDLSPPALHLTFNKIVKKGLFRRKQVEEPVVLTLCGGHETGRIDVSEPFGDANTPQVGIVPFSKANESIRDFFDMAAREPEFPPLL